MDKKKKKRKNHKKAKIIKNPLPTHKTEKNRYEERVEGNIEIRIDHRFQKIRAISRISGKKKFTEKPEDMEVEFWKKVIKGQFCGAQRAGVLDENGQHVFCRSKPLKLDQQHNLNRLPPYRCRYHGGNNRGGPVGNKKRVTHGIYSDALLEGEEELMVDIVGEEDKGIRDLDQEIIMIKVRLSRALKQEAEQHKRLKELQDAEFETGEDVSLLGVCPVTEEIVEIGITKSSVKRIRKLLDFGPMINRIINQLTRLVQLREQIAAQNDTDTADDFADRTRTLLAGMMIVTSGAGKMPILNSSVPNLSLKNDLEEIE